MDIEAAKKLCEAGRRHRQTGQNVAEDGWCDRCQVRWPCPTVYLAAALEKIQQMDCLSDGTGWITKGSECQRDSDPACLHHFAMRVAKERDAALEALEEARGKLRAVEEYVEALPHRWLSCRTGYQGSCQKCQLARILNPKEANGGSSKA